MDDTQSKVSIFKNSIKISIFMLLSHLLSTLLRKTFSSQEQRILQVKKVLSLELL